MTPPDITCWLCQKKVERVKMYYSAMRMATVVTVWCHGEEDECIVPDQAVAEALNGVEGFQQGIAFQPREITIYEHRRGLPRL